MFKKIQKFINPVLSQEYTKASVYYVIANIIGQGIILLSSSVFTRLMSKEDYGYVSTYSTWVLIINTFICLNLFITVRNAYIDFSENYERYNSSVLLLALISGVMVTGLIVIGCIFSGSDFSIEEILLACVQSIALNVVNYMLAIQSMKNQYKQRALLMVLPNWGHTVLSIVLTLIFSQNMYLAKIAGNAFGMLFFGVICATIIFWNCPPKIITKYWKYSCKIALPSIFNTLSDLILMQSDRLMLTSLVGAEETAEYSVVYNVGSIIVAIYQAINGAWTPWFFKRAAKHDFETVKKYQKYYMLFFTIFSCGVMTISPEVIKLISPVNYWGGIRYVAPIVIASYLIFLYAFFSAYLMFKKHTGKVAKNTIIAATVNLVLNYVLIPAYKAEGAVIATVVSYLLLFLLHYFSIENAGKKFFSIVCMWMHVFVMVGYGIIFYFVKDTWTVRYFLYILVLICVLYKYKNEIYNSILGEKEHNAK